MQTTKAFLLHAYQGIQYIGNTTNCFLQSVNHLSWVNRHGEVGYGGHSMTGVIKWLMIIQATYCIICRQLKTSSNSNTYRAVSENTLRFIMITSCHGHIFRVIGPLWGDSTDDPWIPHTKSQWYGAFMYSLLLVQASNWRNGRVTGDLRRPNSYWMLLLHFQS